jgi:hypothetical protein
MRDTFEAILRSGSEELAALVVPVQADQLRAASDRRQRRNLAVSGLLAVAVLVAGGTYAALGHPGLGGGPGRPVTAALRAPGSYYQVGQLNPVTLTVRNPGRLRAATVTVRFSGRSGHGDLVQVRGRSGGWDGRPVTRSGPGGYQSSFPVGLRTGTNAIRLRIQPGSSELVGVRVSTGRTVLASWRKPAYSPNFPSLGNYAPAKASRRLVFSFTATGRRGTQGPPVHLIAYADCLRGCASRPRFRLQWLDGASWRPVPSPEPGSALETRSIPPGGTVAVRLRVTPLPGTGTAQGAVALGVSVPGLDSADASEYFRIRDGLVQLVNAPRQRATIASIRSSFSPGSSQPGTGQVLLARVVTAGQHSYRTPAFAAGQVSVWMVCAGGRSAPGSVQAPGIVEATPTSGPDTSQVGQAVQCGGEPGLAQFGPFSPGAQPDGMKVAVTVPKGARMAVLITRA